jgi:hypothetical protein
MEEVAPKVEIDAEFASLIPALSDEELKGLEESLKRDGCLDHLKVWNHDGKVTLLDGHNRLRLCQKLGFEYQVEPIDINDREDALRWIIDNQLGRRNLTDEQRKYYRGKRLELEEAPGASDGQADPRRNLPCPALRHRRDDPDEAGREELEQRDPPGRRRVVAKRVLPR